MVKVDTARCTGCGACTKVCISGKLVLQGGKAAATQSCLQCGHCVAICPTFAVSIPDYDMADVQPCPTGPDQITPQQYLLAVKARRSVRYFKSGPLPLAQVQRVIEAGRYSATASNSQDVHFLFFQQELARFKTLVWEGWRAFVEDLGPSDAELAEHFAGFLRAYEQDPSQDRLFLDAPAALVVACDTMVDGGIAAANIENMAVAEGLGVLYNGFVERALHHSPAAWEFAGIGKKKIACVMLLGVPRVSFLRTAPRKPANAVYR